MQDIHAVSSGGAGGGGGSGGGRFFGGGDRRLRPLNHQNHQALKCPRCDSLNTKFCYYNNYNLSQPRHFCKSCRRYWTKGGVLRNVPVGGGCRKTKRSKPKSTGGAAAGDAAVKERNSNAQSSSSESSSLTASTTAATPTSAATVASDVGTVPRNTTSNSELAYNLPDSRFFTANPNFDQQLLVHQLPDGQFFPTEIGSFTSLMTSSENMMAFGMTDIPTTTSYGRVQEGNQPPPAADNQGTGIVGTLGVDEFKMQQDLTGSDGLAAALDWGSGGGGGGDPGLFDLTSAVDPAYWSQHQWIDNSDHSLKFLP